MVIFRTLSESLKRKKVGIAYRSFFLLYSGEVFSNVSD